MKQSKRSKLENWVRRRGPRMEGEIVQSQVEERKLLFPELKML
jgi:hypothetical protein